MRNKNWIEIPNYNIINKDKNDLAAVSQSKKLKIHKEKKGKRGKTITIISGFNLENTSQIAVLLKKLKVYCGTGGTLNKQEIQLQGDMQDKAKFFLRKEGYGI
tara:strand:+ start:207 stop:515 length:309 start_codon:yes stop_codon:yes gene_type:complete